MTMTHASLFSGIGGFDLAAEWAGWTNSFNCEIDPFCRRILKYHFPNAEQYADIRTTDFTIWRGRIDVLTGGFPCQPFSLAGKRKGTEDERYLWPKCCGLFGLFDLDGSWARMFSELLIGRKEWSSTRCALTWRRQDVRFNRTLYRLAVSVLPTEGTDAGLLPTVQTQGLKQCVKGRTVPMPTGLLPTPTVNDATNSSLPESQARRKSGLVKEIVKLSHEQRLNRSRLNPLYVAEMMSFPMDWTVLPFLAGCGNRLKPTETP